MVTGDDYGDKDFGDMLPGSSYELEQCCMVLSNMQGLVSRVRMLAPDKCLNVLNLAKYSLSDNLELIELRLVWKR